MLQNEREKVKQFLYQKQDEHAENRFTIEQNLKSLEQENQKLENQLFIDNRGIKEEKKEQQLSNNNFQFNMNLESDIVQRKIRTEFEREINEMKINYDLKIQKLRTDMEEYSNKVIKELEAKKELKIKEITNINNLKYKEIKNYYNDITATNLSLIKSFKQEIGIAQAQDEKDKKLLLRAEDQFTKLSEPLKQKKQQIEKLKADKEHWTIIKNQKTTFRNQIAELEKKYRDIEYCYEIKFQQYEYLEDEHKRL